MGMGLKFHGRDFVKNSIFMDCYRKSIMEFRILSDYVSAVLNFHYLPIW